MRLIELREFKNMSIITAEGYDIGSIIDLRYNPESWKINGIRFFPTARMKELYPNIQHKVMLAPSNRYVVNDVILTGMDRGELSAKFAEDSPKVESSNMLLGKKIFASDGVLLGTVDSVHIDIDSWHVLSLKVKLDKGAHEPLGIKKSFFSKVVSGVLTDFIRCVGDDIKLKLAINELRSEVIIDG